MNDVNGDRSQTSISVVAPKPSSPRQFFARLYGHLEQPTANGTQQDQVAKPAICCDTDSSSDVEIGDSERIESAVSQPVWATPLPLCPRPVLLPHQQLAFGAGLAAFCETNIC